MRNLTPLAAAVLLGLLSVQPVDALEALEPKALKALFPGTFHAVVHGQDVTFDARDDGSLVARSEENKDTGQWSIRQGQLCVMLTSFYRAEPCAHGSSQTATGIGSSTSCFARSSVD